MILQWIWNTRKLQNKWLKGRKKAGNTEPSLQHCPSFTKREIKTWWNSAPKVTQGEYGISRDCNFVSRSVIFQLILAGPTFQMMPYMKATCIKVDQSEGILGEVGLLSNTTIPSASSTSASPWWWFQETRGLLGIQLEISAFGLLEPVI